MLFLVGIGLLLLHVLVPIVNPAPPSPILWGTIIVGWVGVVLMAYAVVARIVRKHGPVGVTVLLAVLVVLGLPAAIWNGGSVTMRGYACPHDHTVTFLVTNTKPPAGCQPLPPSGTFPFPP